MDFYALFGRLGGDCSTKKRACILKQKCGFLCPLVGGLCGAEKGHAFWSKSVDLCHLWASWRRPRRGKRASSLRFQNGDEENCCLI